jgi:hypothetical protein
MIQLFAADLFEEVMARVVARAGAVPSGRVVGFPSAIVTANRWGQLWFPR